MLALIEKESGSLSKATFRLSSRPAKGCQGIFLKNSYPSDLLIPFAKLLEVISGLE